MRNYSPLKWITIGSIVIAAIALFVLLKTCKHVPKDDSKAKIDSITAAQEAREHALKITNDSLQAAAEYAQALADSFYVLASNAQDRSEKYYTSYLSAKTKYAKLLQDSSRIEGIADCGDIIHSADSTIHFQKVALLSKDSSIGRLRLSVNSLYSQVQTQKQSAAGFKADFMKLKTEVIPPLQANLAEANKQWKRNRAAKKTFAGIAVAAIAVAVFESIKH